MTSSSGPITCLGQSSNDLLNLCQNILTYHYNQNLQSPSRLFYHDQYPTLGCRPDFIREGVEGEIIFVNLRKGETVLKQVSEEDVQLCMEIMKRDTAMVVDIILVDDPTPPGERRSPRKTSTSDTDSITHFLTCFKSISETLYIRDPVFFTEYLETHQMTQSKKRKTSDENTFDKNLWISASRTRNFALDNTLDDWLDMYYVQKKNLIERFQVKLNDNDSMYFPKHLMNQGVMFERAVMTSIRDRFQEHEIITICPNMDNYHENVMQYEKNTVAAIKRGIPIIYQGVVMNKEGPLIHSYGLPDLLVRADVLSRLVDNPPVIEPELINKRYVVVDIKWTKLGMCTDKETLRTEGSIPAYKTQLYVYNKALGYAQGYEPKCAYILGRGWKMESRGVEYGSSNCYDRLGVINYHSKDKMYVQTAIDALKWVRELRTHGSQWDLYSNDPSCYYPKPTDPRLYPNMSSSLDSNWKGLKQKYAREIGEITQITHCGVKNREIGLKNGIRSIHDPACTALNLGLRGEKLGPLVDQIIAINRRDNFAHPLDRIHIEMNPELDNQWTENHALMISIDFETINGIFDDFATIPLANDESYLFMIGMTHKFRDQDYVYRCFLLPTLNRNEELIMIVDFLRYLRDVTDQCLGPASPIPLLYHWGHIEKSFFHSSFERLTSLFPLPEDVTTICETLRWYDMLRPFKDNPIVVNGCFAFGLKEITKRLYELGLIMVNWDDNNPCSNGSSAMVFAYKIYQSGRDVNENTMMRHIQEYNKIDCLAIHEVVGVLRRKMAV